MDGRISALLELGAGFNMEYTGIENVYLNGTMLGFTKEEIDERLDNILEFADIGDFVNQPVKSYSSGMFVRLAFAVAINIDPEILIVDEHCRSETFFQANVTANLRISKKKVRRSCLSATTLEASQNTVTVRSCSTRARRSLREHRKKRLIFIRRFWCISLIRLNWRQTAG